MVYDILMAATDSPDPADFKKSVLFKECVENGIIPSPLDALSNEIPIPLPGGDSKKDPIASAHQTSHTIDLKLSISGMWCPACAWVIGTVAEKIEGVISATCHFERDFFSCSYDPIRTSPDAIKKGIQKIGYDASENLEEKTHQRQQQDLLRLILVSLFTMNVMMLSIALYSGFFTDLSANNIWKISIPIFLMAGVVFFYGGAPIFKRALSGMRSGYPGMEVLIAIGATSAFGFSIYSLFKGSLHLYFDTSAMLITLTLIGKYIEARAKRLVQKDMSYFFDLLLKKVCIVSEVFPNGRYANYEQLKKGDRFKVREKEVVPADGIIVEGAGTLSFAAITGEPRPVEKRAGDKLTSGIRVETGTFIMRCEQTGKDSLIGQMTHALEHTLSQKVPLEGKTDYLLKWFVPFILLLSSGTFLILKSTGFPLDTAMIRAITLLVISCPCALGIAIPLTRVVGVFLALKKGLLIKDFTSFETIGKIDTVVLDKTGTLTKGIWSLRDIQVLDDGFSKNDLLNLAFGLEQEEDHPVAVAIRKMARRERLEGARVENIYAGDSGITGIFNHQILKIGSASFLSEEIEKTGELPSVDLSMETIVSHIYISLNGVLVGRFLFGDELRKSAGALIQKLKEKNFKMYILSGDEKKATIHVGNLLNIPKAYGGMLPQDKAAFIKQLINDGKKVAMVGDGMNDALALAESNLSIGVYSGYPLGKETAQITIMKGDPYPLIHFFEFAEKVNQKIYQNLLAAFIYNVIAIPIAMSGLLNPLVAVSAMLLSSLSVIFNVAVFLNRYQEKN